MDKHLESQEGLKLNDSIRHTGSEPKAARISRRVETSPMVLVIRLKTDKLESQEGLELYQLSHLLGGKPTYS